MSIDPVFIKLSRALRKNQTPWEKKLWMHLKGRRLFNLKFKRQVVLGRYIYDFGCFEKKLVIELDGSQHFEDDNKESDWQKENYARLRGYRVLRFSNPDVQTSLQAVLDTIGTVALQSTSSVSPFGKQER